MSDIKDLVYKQFLHEKSIVINGEINSRTIDRVTMQIIKFNLEDDELEKDGCCDKCKNNSYDRLDDPINMYINSPGGGAYATLAVVGAIEASATPIVTHVVGESCSGAFIIGISGHKRVAYQYSRFMWHKLGVSVMGGSIDEINDDVDDMALLQEVFDNIIITKTKITREQLHEMTLRKDWSFLSSKAIELGVIDEITPKALSVKREPLVEDGLLQKKEKKTRKKAVK